MLLVARLALTSPALCCLNLPWLYLWGPFIHHSTIVTEPAEPGRAEEDEAASDLPTAVISPNLVAKQDPVLAEVAQSAEKFLDAVVKVGTLSAAVHSLAVVPEAQSSDESRQ